MVTTIPALNLTDSLRTPKPSAGEGSEKRETVSRRSNPVEVGAGARDRTGGLPFTRRREVVPRADVIEGVVSKVSSFRRWHYLTGAPPVTDSGATEGKQGVHADSQRTPLDERKQS